MKEDWHVLSRETIFDHPFLKVAVEQVRLPDGKVIRDWPMVHARDYANVLALNALGEALILEGYKHGAGCSSWQVVGGYLEEGEEPLAAIQRELLEETGCQSDDWRYLGSYVVDANRYVGTGHFYVARNVHKIAAPTSTDLETFTLRWVPIPELKKALSDGRIQIVSYALNISLALLTLE